MLSLAIKLAIRCYQYSFGAVLPGACRFEPTCSEFALQAVSRHGPVRGVWLAVKRVARCHPFGGRGYDPVPGNSSQAQPGDSVVSAFKSKKARIEGCE